MIHALFAFSAIAFAPPMASRVGHTAVAVAPRAPAPVAIGGFELPKCKSYLETFASLADSDNYFLIPILTRVNLLFVVCVRSWRWEQELPAVPVRLAVQGQGWGHGSRHCPGQRAPGSRRPSVLTACRCECAESSNVHSCTVLHKGASNYRARNLPQYSRQDTGVRI